MQLEQTLEMYQPMQIQRTKPEMQRVYTIVNLESLSASALYGISGPLGGSGPLRLTGGPRGFKILGNSGPLMRLDYPAHHGLPEMHLQYGKKEFLGRSGNEAADILAEVLRLNPKIKFPGIDEDK